jgi:hypothetical protein
VAVEDRHFERDEQYVGQLARARVHGREVAPGPRSRVADEVFERRVHALRLQTTDVRGADRSHEVRILGDALVDPTPAGVAYHIEHRRQPLVDAERAHRRSDGGTDLGDEVGVERRAPGERCRKRRRLPRRQAGQALLVHDRRNAEPGPGDQVALECPEPRRTDAGVDRSGAVGPGEVPEPVPREVLEARDRTELALERRDGLAVLLLQNPTIWASFSANVIRPSRSSTRASSVSCGRS